MDLMPLEEDVMIERYVQKYLPQIFIDDQHIGGLNDLRELDSSGDLDKLLTNQK